MEISNGAILLLQSILGLMAGILGALAWLAKQILSEVRRTNGRLTAVEIHLKEHFKLDDVRFSELRERLERDER